MNEKKISIIIPIYNGEKYLKECIDSVINQKYNNLEIILINDGSTDKTEKICLDYKKNDSRIIYIYQENSGVSAARNKGIEISSGNYIIFLDSDDSLELYAIEKINENIENTDLLCFGYRECYVDQKRDIILNENIYDKKEIEEKILITQTIGGYLWNKVFDARIIKENNIVFDNNIHFCEDLLFVINYFKYCEKTIYIKEILYNYKMRKSGASYNFFNKKSLGFLKTYEKIIKEEDLNLKHKEIFMYRYIFTYYKLRKIVDIEQFEPNKEIMIQEKRLFKQQEFKEKIKFIIIKYFYSMFRILRCQKIKKLKLFE